MEALTPDQVKNGVMFAFHRFLSRYFDVPEPLRIIYSKWNSNPFSRGSYSSRSPLTDARGGSAFDMSLPLNNTAGKPVVLFAGEATHPKYYSAVHGAVETGWREAERLMNL